MSDSVVFNRRDFLKLVGVGVAGAAAGCAKPPAERLIPYLVAPEDILPGVPYFYASTCRECPAGCGIVVRSREGRAIKLEGNPDHPVNQGGLCARGQAGLQGLYDPDRLKTPMLKENGKWRAATWDEALKLAGEKLGAAKGKLLLLTGREAGTFRQLAREVATAAGGRHVMWEPYGYEAVRAANQKTFGIAAVPRYDFAAARCVISFGADFLETFGSPVAQARGYAAMRAKRDDGAGWFVSVEPRLSLTGANADEWVAIRPGTEAALALGLAHVILAENLGPAVPERAALQAAVAAWTPEEVARQTDVTADSVKRLARLFVKSGAGLALAGGIATQSAQATSLVAAVNLLNYAAGSVGRTVLFDRPLDFDGVSSFAAFADDVKAMGAGAFEAVIVHGANPAYAMPRWAGFAEAFAKVPFKVALASAMDETSDACDLVLPVQHALEAYGDDAGTKGVWSLQQPAMRPLPMFDARSAGDALLQLGTAAGVLANAPATWLDYLRAKWQPVHARLGGGRDFETFWLDSLKAGGVWENATHPAVRWSGTPAFATAPIAGEGEYTLILVPSSNFYDGRSANRPWLQELPDMTSKAVWGSWVEIHPDTAKRLGIASGESVLVSTGPGGVAVPAYLYAGIRPDTVALALGQGHTSYGRYATGRGVNALGLLPQATDAASGALAYFGTKASLTAQPPGTLVRMAAGPLYLQQAEKDQHGRHISRVITVAELLGAEDGLQHEVGAAHGDVGESKPRKFPYPGQYPAGEGSIVEPTPAMTKPGKYTEPLARPDTYRKPAHAITAFESEMKVRGPKADPINIGSYAHATHRWAMAIDLDACTGCGACVVACYAENNIPVVGPELIRNGREMAWIRIDRFEEKLAPGASDVRFIPMMCQHCGDAPCEMVCPVYATYHTPEGLNGQVYNRCVGTRYCSNNCPYKVRAFNWFEYSAPEKVTFAFPEPLNWQLNPDVTVRSKGVMEKCTMCIQRILEGKGNAKDENRPVLDGEIQTACAQSCPAKAITFGDLADESTAVHKASHGERRYWVFEELNTKPGVTYLQKVKRDTMSGGAA
jgi:molybdopterin-containing oxidoreductase family iron-sulfur binding subunit